LLKSLTFIYRLVSIVILILVGVNCAKWAALFYLITGILVLWIIIKISPPKRGDIYPVVILYAALFLVILISIVQNVMVKGFWSTSFLVGYAILYLLEFRLMVRLASVPRAKSVKVKSFLEPNAVS